jgi:hypothetical protein
MLPAAWAVCLDVGRRHAGAVSGAMNSAGQAAGCICMSLYGYMIVSFGYELPLILFAVNMFIGAIFFALIDPTQPLVNDLPVIEPAAEPALAEV